MKTRYRIVLLFVCMMVPTLAIAQSPNANGQARQSENAAIRTDTKVDMKAGTKADNKPDKKHHMYRGSKIIGADIRNPQDKKLGEIKDILLDSERGEVAFVVASFGGPMGLLGSKYHAIPWQALQPSDDGKHYVLYADRETIGKAPAFDQRQWPDLADHKWSTDVDRYWNRMVGHGPTGGITTSSGAASGSDSTKERSKGNGHKPAQ